MYAMDKNLVNRDKLSIIDIKELNLMKKNIRVRLKNRTLLKSSPIKKLHLYNISTGRNF